MYNYKVLTVAFIFMLLGCARKRVIYINSTPSTPLTHAKPNIEESKLLKVNELGKFPIVYLCSEHNKTLSATEFNRLLFKLAANGYCSINSFEELRRGGNVPIGKTPIIILFNANDAAVNKLRNVSSDIMNGKEKPISFQFSVINANELKKYTYKPNFITMNLCESPYSKMFNIQEIPVIRITNSIEPFLKVISYLQIHSEQRYISSGSTEYVTFPKELAPLLNNLSTGTKNAYAY